MSVISPLQTIEVGVVVERSKGVTQWSEYAWRPVERARRRAGDAILDQAHR